MNFNVHRRNKSLLSQNKLREKREQKSNKRMAHEASIDSILQEAKDIYYTQNRLNEATNLFEQYLAIHPKHNQSLYLCGVSYLHQGQPQQAIEKLSTISEESENKPNAMLLTAMALNKLGNISKSLEVVSECIKRYELFEEAICFRGKVYMGMNFYHKAEIDFKTVINNLSNPSFLSYVGLADCYRFQAKTDKALTYYCKALDSIQEGRQGIQHKHEIQLKVAICLYQLQRFKQSKSILDELAKSQTLRSSELFYYLGQTQIKLGFRQKSLLHLEYCLRMSTNTKIIKKAYKKLLQIYLQNFQFYEALNIIKLGDICKVDLEWWKKTAESFMLIIKGEYNQGVKNLATVLEQLHKSEEKARAFKIKRDSSDDKSRRETRYHQQSLDYTKKLALASPNKNRDNYYSKDKIAKKLAYFSTKSVARAVPKIQSTRVNSNSFYSYKKQQFRLKTQHNPQPAAQVAEQKDKSILSIKQKEFLVPLILSFKAYGQFFTNNFMKCLDTYEQYDAFLKDMFGRQSDMTYNKTLCEALLMSQSDMADESLSKFSACVDLYYDKYETIPQEPLLYKIMILIRLAITKNIENQQQDQEDASFQEILESTLEMIKNYKPAINSHYLTHYFRAIIFILLDKLEQARESLQKTLKISQECSWKLLYVKGVVQMLLGNYYDAVKQFSAGLILESRAQFYLGRSISFLMLSEKEQKTTSDNSIQMLMRSVHISSQLRGHKQKKKSSSVNKGEVLVENCFEDLQKYIQLQNNQEEISLWVSKILFANKAYDQAVRSLTKITQQTPEVISMIESIQIYEGEFEGGGKVGKIIKAAFDGTFLSTSQQNSLLNQKLLKNYNNTQFSYLSQQYQKWLVTLHLYVKQNYQTLTKYLQKEIFGCEDDLTQLLLRYNVAIMYLMMGEHPKAQNVFKGLLKYQEKFDVQPHLNKILSGQFQVDECIPDLRQEVGIGCSKLLSNYLPYQAITILNHRQESIKIYVRILIPFPKFPLPNLNLSISNQFLLNQLSSNLIEKKIQAPWIRKVKNKNIQFTQNMEESVADLDDIGNTKSMKGENEPKQH